VILDAWSLISVLPSLSLALIFTKSLKGSRVRSLPPLPLPYHPSTNIIPAELLAPSLLRLVCYSFLGSIPKHNLFGKARLFDPI